MTARPAPAAIASAQLSLLPIALGCLFFAAALSSILLFRDDGRIAAIWLPNAVMLGLLLRIESLRIAPTLAWLFPANLAANLVVGDATGTALTLALANNVEIGVAYALIARWVGPRPDLEDLRALGRVLVSACVVAPSTSGLIAMAALAGPDASTTGAAWAIWVLTDGLGMMLIAPAVMIALDAVRAPSRPTALADWRAWALVTGIGIAVSLLVFAQSSYPLLFLCAPVILFHAYRLGMFATALGTLLIAVIATVATSLDSGPIALMDGSLTSRLIVLQVFLASMFATGLPVAAALARKRRLLADLADRERQLALLANNVTDAVLRFDLDGTCVDASPSVREVLARSREDFIGRSATALTHPESSDQIAAVTARLLTGEIDKQRFTYRRLKDYPDGTPVYIEADCAVVRHPETGAREAIIVCARDVSERVVLERQLKRARRHAENAAAAKSQFLANMSHEIRTPMNGVLGFAELLQRSDLTAEQHRQLALIRESGESMMRLLNDILDISKIEAGQIAVQNEAVDLRELIGGCVSLHSANAERKGIALTSRIAPDLPPMIESDTLRLRQILLNLIGNAVKFTSHGSVRIEAGVEGDTVVLSVTDTGIGIAPAGIAEIFEPFRQADGTTARQFGGTGLGLTISRQLATLLGGTLSVTSEPGHGSCFTLAVPARLVAPGEEPRHDAASTRPERDALPACHILLAEDHDINRLLVTAMLESCGQRVTHAENGEVAVRLLTTPGALPEPVDLVLMDVQMPEMDGFTATRTIRAAGYSETDIPIVALTANAYEEDIVASRLAGMQDHLAKPLQLDELKAALRRWLPTAAPQEKSAPPPFVASPNAPSPRLRERWAQRRQEALDAVAALLRSGQFAGAEADEVARAAHKLAGTAAMFGEQELGEVAARLEDALRGRSDGDPGQLARTLLEAA